MRRRLAGGFGVLAFLAAGLAGAGVAHATGTSVGLSWSSPVVVLQQWGQGGGVEENSTSLVADNPGADTTVDVTYTFDFGGLAGIAQGKITSKGLTCTTSGTTETCQGHQTVHHGSSALVGLELLSLQDNKTGDSGSVKLTARADGVDFHNADFEVQVGGPQLQVSPQVPNRENIENTAVGDVYKGRIGVVNRGDEEAQGVLLEMDVTNGLDFVTKYSNCEYAELPKATTSSVDTWEQPVTEAVCEISTPVGAGLYGELSEQIQLSVNKRALVDGFSYKVLADTAAARAGLRGSAEFTKGTGPALAMGPLQTIHDDQGGNATDTWVSDTGGLLFETHGTADFAAKGGSASGRAGDTVKATVGYTNLGPAWFGAYYNTQTVTTFTVPQGTEVVQKPEACTKSGDGVYTCDSHASLTVGQPVSYTFTLKIDEVVENASGTVKVSAPGIFYDAQYDPDKNPANDTATFTLTGEPGNGTGGGSASGTSGSGGNSPGAQGDQGGLADTGARGLGVVGGAALLALAVGGGLWFAARRRSAQA